MREKWLKNKPKKNDVEVVYLRDVVVVPVVLPLLHVGRVLLILCPLCCTANTKSEEAPEPKERVRESASARRKIPSSASGGFQPKYRSVAHSPLARHLEEIPSFQPNHQLPGYPLCVAEVHRARSNDDVG